MKVLVLGAGVVGVTTAWYLAEAGHEVTVVDRQPGPALETSFANGGQISPCHSEPWANPSTPLKALRWMGREDAPLIVRWRRWDPALWAWGCRFLLNCTAERARRHTGLALGIALYSRRCLQELRAATDIDYDHKTLGILHVYRDPGEFRHAAAAAELMSGMGLERLVRTPAEAVMIEPALEAVRPQLAGAIFTPGDESGDAHLFTCRLAEKCASRGVRFLQDTRILNFEGGRDRVTAVATDGGRLRADAFVLALGSWSPRLAGQLGLRLPVYPAKGYSATLRVTQPAAAPTVSITDDEHKMVFSRLGDRLRCAGTAELAGWDPTLVDSRAKSLVANARALFPGAGDYDGADLWAGLRPLTPDSLPILGATPVANLFLNTGHGTMGWTMACGSGKLVADLMSGRQPEISVEGLGLERF